MFSASGSPVLGKKSLKNALETSWPQDLFERYQLCNPVNLVKVKACEGLMGSPAGEFSSPTDLKS